MSNKNSFEYYGLWEQINNENFNSVEFHVIKTEEAPYNRIYDLYNGTINERNSDGIFSIHLGLLRKVAFGYKEMNGINAKENEICGDCKENLSKRLKKKSF